jgi:hypothetical protein
MADPRSPDMPPSTRLTALRLGPDVHDRWLIIVVGVMVHPANLGSDLP